MQTSHTLKNLVKEDSDILEVKLNVSKDMWQTQSYFKNKMQKEYENKEKTTCHHLPLA